MQLRSICHHSSVDPVKCVHIWSSSKLVCCSPRPRIGRQYTGWGGLEAGWATRWASRRQWLHYRGKLKSVKTSLAHSISNKQIIITSKKKSGCPAQRTMWKSKKKIGLQILKKHDKCRKADGRRRTKVGIKWQICGIKFFGILKLAAVWPLWLFSNLQRFQLCAKNCGKIHDVLMFVATFAIKNTTKIRITRKF